MFCLNIKDYFITSNVTNFSFLVEVDNSTTSGDDDIEFKSSTTPTVSKNDDFLFVILILFDNLE